MTIKETIKTIDEPKGWLKITPSDIRNLNDYCKKLESENQQLVLSGVSKSLPCKKCNDNGGFTTMEGWETCTNCL
jgi:hypothetical protein